MSYKQYNITIGEVITFEQNISHELTEPPYHVLARSSLALELELKVKSELRIGITIIPLFLASQPPASREVSINLTHLKV